MTNPDAPSDINMGRIILISFEIFVVLQLLCVLILRWLDGPSFLNVAVGVAILGLIGTWANFTRVHFDSFLEKKSRFLWTANCLLAVCTVLLLLVAGVSPANVRDLIPDDQGDSRNSPTVASPSTIGGSAGDSAKPETPPSPACQNSQPPPSTPWGPERPLISPYPLDANTWPSGSSPSFNNVELAPSGENGRVEDLRMRLITAKNAEDNRDNGYLDEVSVVPGGTYRVRVMALNTAQPRVGLEARDVRMFVYLPECMANEAQVVASFLASNTAPPNVWGSVRFVSDRPFRMVPAGRQAKGLWNSAGFQDYGDASSAYSANGAVIGAPSLNGTVEPSAFIDFLLYLTPQF
jgi:hypothetical protein